ncbi:MAG: hypothetical protein IPL65_13510 [Lewinellaceae bacterium]|nr:hypothetical protein [Lewinellaceae bacterium]
MIAYENPIDFTAKNQFTVQVYSEKAGTLLLKVEGGVGPKEAPFQMTPGEWGTYTLDCSDQIGKGHNKFIIFFNAGVNGDPGDVYYIDNIALTAPSTAPPLEDFEGMVHLGWQPLNQDNTLHGNFSAPTANTAPNGVSNSAEVGCYTLGASPFSALQAF